ncbi:MAG: hypothetical protein K8R59_00485 [Thermoanaerobaculales bacterium]|nr:hypothetical protein [Thermoanaerobaculales bacterium]
MANLFFSASTPFSSPGAREEDDALLAFYHRHVGSGGSLAGSVAFLPDGTGGYPTLRNQRQIQTIPLDDPADRIAMIRSALSLNVKELADVLHVERPTVYSWIAGTAQPRAVNRGRLAIIADLAHEWTSLHKRPLGTLRKETGPDGNSIIGLLEADPNDKVQVRRLFEAAAAKLSPQRKVGINLAERALARGVILAEPPDAQRELDRLTGRRIASE